MAQKRFGLIYGEYKAMQEAYASLLTLYPAVQVLKRRFPGAKGNLDLIPGALSQTLASCVATLPQRGVHQIRQELKHMHIFTRTNAPAPGENLDGCAYVDVNVLKDLIERAMQMDCAFCDKCGQDVEQCQLREAILSTYNHDWPERNDGRCVFSECSSV